jgi:type IV pilus assembly protein PilB
VQSALTGHLVFTTVHANNVVDVLGRFLNMKVELYNFVSALNCVLGQRLVRKICLHCKERSRSRPSSARAAWIRWPEDQVFYEGKGCLECNGTGFHGRMAIAELLDLSDRIRGLILERRPRPRSSGGQGGGNGLPARRGAGEGLRGLDDDQGDQQGDLR